MELHFPGLLCIHMAQEHNTQYFHQPVFWAVDHSVLAPAVSSKEEKEWSLEFIIYFQNPRKQRNDTHTQASKIMQKQYQKVIFYLFL